MATILAGIYNTIIKRNAIFLSAIFVGAFATEIAFDTVSNSIWDQVNKGRQWKDIKHRYLDQEEEDE